MLAGKVVAFFVNGFGGGSVPEDAMERFQNELEANTLVAPADVAIYETNWNSPDPTYESGDPGANLSPSDIVASVTSGSIPLAADPISDGEFVINLSNILRNEYDDDDTIILVGHSFGADSVFKVAQALEGEREIDLLATLDRVGTAGFRTEASLLPDAASVSRNVRYFYNRWQNNFPFPFDITASDHKSFLNPNREHALAEDFGITDQKPKNTTDEHGCTLIDVAAFTCKVRTRIPTSDNWNPFEEYSDALHHGGFPLDREIQEELGTIMRGLVPAPPTAVIDIQPGLNVPEGTVLTLDGSGSSDPNPEDLTYQWYADPDFAGGAIADPNGEITTMSLGDDGLVDVTLEVVDEGGRLGYTSQSVLVSNVAPVVDPIPNVLGVRGHETFLIASFTDPGFLDTHEISWATGDGAVLPYQDTATWIPPHYTYVNEGSFSATATVRDDDGGIGTGTTSVDIKTMALVPLYSNPASVQLQVGGTLGDDVIEIRSGATFGSVEVTLNGVVETFSPTADIIVRAQSGNDVVRVIGALPQAVSVYGDEGNDDISFDSVRGSNYANGGMGTDVIWFHDDGSEIDVDNDAIVSTSGGGTEISIENISDIHVLGGASNNRIDASDLTVTRKLYLDGAGGDDVLVVRSGETYLSGGQGNDRYEIQSASTGGNTHTIEELLGEGIDVLSFASFTEAVTSTDHSGTSLAVAGSGVANVAVAGQQANIEIGLNIAPHVEITSAPSLGVPFMPLEYEASFVDVGTQSTHTAILEWGNGESSSGLVSEAQGRGAISSVQRFDEVGTYAVEVTVVDNEGLSNSTLASTEIREFALMPDQKQPGLTALYVGGTVGPDVIKFRERADDSIRVTYKGRKLGDFAFDGGVFAYGGSGNDWIEFVNRTDKNLTFEGGGDVDVLIGSNGDDMLFGQGGKDDIYGRGGNDMIDGGDELDQIFGGSGDDVIDAGSGNDIVFGNTGFDYIVGGSGNDKLVGGAGDDILVGNNGNDRIFGNAGHDLLLGGSGSDDIVGAGGDDLLVADRTIYDSDTPALIGIRNEWLSGTSLSVRMANLVSGGGLNGTTTLVAGVSVLDDGFEDILDSGTGSDWHWLSADDIARRTSNRRDEITIV